MQVVESYKSHSVGFVAVCLWCSLLNNNFICHKYNLWTYAFGKSHICACFCCSCAMYYDLVTSSAMWPQVTKSCRSACSLGYISNAFHAANFIFCKIKVQNLMPHWIMWSSLFLASNENSKRSMPSLLCMKPSMVLVSSRRMFPNLISPCLCCRCYDDCFRCRPTASSARTPYLNGH